MEQLLTILLGIVALAVFLWLMWPSGTTVSTKEGGDDNRILDPSDPQQVSFLIGLTGGQITDAAVAVYALQRFEATHGRKPTMRDVGTVVGMMRTL